MTSYLSLARIAARWDVSLDTARERLRDCPRLKLGRAVRYSLAGVEAIERDALRTPGEAPRRPRRRAAEAATRRVAELRRELGLA